MSKLEELLKEYCPNGVEYKKIGEVVCYEQPSKYIVESTKYSDEYTIPVLTAGQSFILGYTNETNGIYHASEEEPVIIFDDFTGAFKWVDFDFKVKSSALKILKANPKYTSTRYIYHCMGVLNFTSSEHKRLWISIYSEFQIPLPALAVQSEIVHILDSFTLYSQELTAELTARRKQYEYYRNKLLTFENEFTSLSLNDIYDFQYGEGNTIPENKGEYPVYGSNGWVGTYNDRFNSENSPVIGHIGAYAGIVNWVEGKHFVTYNGIICKHKNSNVDKRFAYHLLKNQNFLAHQKGPQPFISYDLLKNTYVNIPPLDIQNRIVEVLDNFDKICSDLEIGLPAEIEARKKQYEYYRDKLLTFKEKAE